MFRKRDCERAAKQFKKIMKSNACCLLIMDYLSAHFSSNTYPQLILGSKDPEIAASFSIFEKKRVTLKARQIVDAL